MKDHSKMIDETVELLSQGLSGPSEARIVAQIRKKNPGVDTKEAMEIVKMARIKMAGAKKLEQLRAEAEATAKALKEAEEAARQAEREAKEAEERAKALAEAEKVQSAKVQILTQLHKVIVTSFKDAVLEIPEVTNPYTYVAEPSVALSPGRRYPNISVQARQTPGWRSRFLGWGIAVVLEPHGKTRVYPELKNGGYSYDKIVKVIQEHLEIEMASEKRKAEEAAKRQSRTEMAEATKKELGLRATSAVIQGMLDQSYHDAYGKFHQHSYKADEGKVWLVLGSRQCTPEQAKVVIDAMRAAGFDLD